MTQFVGFRVKTYGYLLDDGNEDKIGKSIKKCATKRKLKFEIGKYCFEATQIENKTKHLEKIQIKFQNKIQKKIQMKNSGKNNKLKY